MLTKDDLEQIRGVVREEVENEIDAAKTEIKSGVITSRMQVQGDIRELKGRVKNVEIGITRMHKAIQGVDKKLDKVQEDVAEILATAIDEHGKLEKRVARVEDHLDLGRN